MFFLLVLADKLAYIEVIHTEILSPRGETMGFVNNKAYNIACQQNLLYRLRS